MSKELSLEQAENIIAEIDGFIKIIDTLNLNTRIWTKE